MKNTWGSTPNSTLWKHKDIYTQSMLQGHVLYPLGAMSLIHLDGEVPLKLVDELKGSLKTTLAAEGHKICQRASWQRGHPHSNHEQACVLLLRGHQVQALLLQHSCTCGHKVGNPKLPRVIACYVEVVAWWALHWWFGWVHAAFIKNLFSFGVSHGKHVLGKAALEQQRY